MVVVPLPPVVELERLLSGLLMRPVKVAAGAAPGTVDAVAHYRTDAPVLEVAVVLDLPLAAAV
ncbi:MAG TPA: hypothetical protein VD838_00135, partial [Anaeromyxobacteraceae bacterium]|nr:hypothetical protein [Anaeromyxobacteraceae bacterium]